MTSLIKKAIAFSVRNNVIWSLFDRTINRMSRYATRARRGADLARNGTNVDTLGAVLKIAPQLIVRHGPFKGMRYPDAKAVGSVLVPKLLGSYERELHTVLERICSQQYSEIVDIGCAEGYYAIGLAMRIKSAKVFAFDTKPVALKLTRRMAQLNHVNERIVTGGFCDAATLRQLPLTEKALILSDCEGFEKELFKESVISSLAKHDLLIEVHDFIDIETSSIIRQRFEKTHQIESIQSIDDITKAHSYGYGELHDYDLATRKALLAERRPAIMEWFYMMPRTV